MGKHRKTSGTRLSPSRLEDEVHRALSGGRVVDARQLLVLLHDVNPSGRDLGPDAVRRRYEAKSALQSLLIRQHRDDLIVERGESEDLVGLRHRRLPLDACHTSISSLDDEARSWVRLQLDQEPEGSIPRPAPAVPRPPADTRLSSFEIARQAMEEFDYPAAREHLLRAWEEDGGLEVAVPLLELLVDTLAADEDALALVPGMSSTVMKHPVIRGLLALAAARSRRFPQALTLTEGGDAHGAPALVLLTDHALAIGSEAEALLRLERLADLDPAHPDLVRLREGLVRLRVQAREPLEAELAVALDRGATGEARMLAKRILERWSESGPARRGLALLDAKDRKDRAQSRFRLAQGAHGAGELDRAAALLREAMAIDPGHPEVAALLAEVAAAAEVQAEARAVAEVEARLAVDLEEGLVSYLSAEPKLRTRVQGGGVHIHRARLDRLAPAPEDRREAVAAVLALARAEAAAGQHPAQAKRLLAPHLPALASLPEANALMSAIDVALAEAQRASEEEALAKAARAVDARDWASARELLGSLPRSVAQTALTAGVEEGDARDRLIAEVGHRQAAGHFLLAREAVDALLARGGTDHARWATQRAELDRQVRRQWMQRSEALTGQEPVGHLERMAEGFHFTQQIECLVTDQGTPLLVGAEGPWLFVQEVGPGQRVVRQMSLRAPFRWGYRSASLDRGFLWVASDRGEVVQLALSDWAIVRHRSLADSLEAALIYEDVLVPRGGRNLWAKVHRPTEITRQVKVFDLGSWRAVRTVSVFHGTSVVAGSEPMLAVTHMERGGALHVPNGSVAKGQPPLPTAWRLIQVARSPTGAGTVCLVADPSDNRLELGVVDANGGAPTWIPETSFEAPSALATSQEERLTFVLCTQGNGSLLIAREAQGPELYRVLLPPMAVLLHDGLGRGVTVACLTSEGVATVGLGRRPPQLPAGPSVIVHQLPVNSAAACADLVLPRIEQTAELYETAVRSVSKGALLPHDFDLARNVVAFHHQLRLATGPQSQDVFREMSIGAFATFPIVRYYWAYLAARKFDWAAVRQAIDGIGMEGLNPSELRHLRHLQGLICFREGDFARAAAVWREGLALDPEDPCGLRSAVTLVESFTAPEGPQHPLVQALRAGDRCFAAGDAAGAVKALDQPVVHELGEMQTMARLVEAYLRATPLDAAEQFRMRKCLARFVEACEPSEPWRQPIDLPFAGAWNAEQVREVERQARAWLALD